MKEENTSKYFRSRIRGNFCENCHKVFSDGDIIFTPEEISITGEKEIRYFCGDNCLQDNLNKRKPKMKFIACKNVGDFDGFYEMSF